MLYEKDHSNIHIFRQKHWKFYYALFLLLFGLSTIFRALRKINNGFKNFIFDKKINIHINFKKSTAVLNNKYIKKINI